MVAGIFEVRPKPGCRDAYLDIAADLRPLLAGIDGFISIERFQSLADPEKVLSISFWRDEAAVAQWRKIEAHRAAQAQGRTALFADYRIRVAEVLRDYGMAERAEVPDDSRALHG